MSGEVTCPICGKTRIHQNLKQVKTGRCQPCSAQVLCEERNSDRSFQEKAYAGRMKRLREDPEFRAIMAAAARKNLQDWNCLPGSREIMAERIRKANADPEIRERRLQGKLDFLADTVRSAKMRLSISEKARIRMQDPKRRALFSNRMKAFRAEHPEMDLLASRRLSALWLDPDYRERMTKLSSIKRSAMNATPEFKAAQSKMAQALNADPEFRRLQRRGMALWYIPKDVQNRLSDDEVAVLSLPEVRNEIIAAMEQELSQENYL